MKNAVAATNSRLLPLVCSLVVLFVLGGSGCVKKSPAPGDTGTPQVNEPAPGPADQPPAPEPNQAAAEPQTDKVLVTVNGTPITEGQVKRRIQAEYGPQLAKLAAQSPEFAAQQEKLLVQNLTGKLVVEQLLDEQAKAANITMTEEEVVAGITKEVAARYPGVTLQKFKEMVTAQGGDFQAVKESLARSMKYNRLFESKWADSIAVTEDEVRKYYDEHPKEFEKPEQVRASHILIRTTSDDPNADPNQVKVQAKEEIEQVFKQVKEGADFAELAKEHSDCPSAAEGGDLSYFEHGKMVKPFEDAAFALQPGEISDIVETQFGYHIIKVTDRREASQTAFEDTKSDITDTLTQQKKTDFVRKYIDSLKEQAKIVYASPEATPANQSTIPARRSTVTPAPTTTPAPTPAPAPAPSPAPAEPNKQ